MDAKINFTKDQLDLIKKTCIPKNADAEHFDLLVYTAEKYGLDPLTKEIVLDVRTSRKTGEKRAVIITTRDGYLKAAMQDSAYNGVNGGVIREGDTVETDPIAGRFKHCFGEKRGKIIAAWAVAKAKNRDPIICIADYEEYAKANASSHTWKDYPSAMIQKVAEIMAMKRQFNITGMVGEEEITTGLIETPNPDEPVIINPSAEEADKKSPEEMPDKILLTINAVIMGSPRKKNDKYSVQAVLFGETEEEAELIVPAEFKDLLADGSALWITGFKQDGKFSAISVKPFNNIDGDSTMANNDVVKLLSEPKEGTFNYKAQKMAAPWAYVEYQGKTENVFAVGEALSFFNKNDVLDVTISDSITKDNKIMLFIETAEKSERIAN